MYEVFKDEEYISQTMKLRVMYMQGKTKNSVITDQLQKCFVELENKN